MKESRGGTSNVCSHRRVCWSKLPGKIIFKISKHLKTRDDVAAFKQVCSKWRKRSLDLPRSLLSFNVPLPRTLKHSFNVLPFHNFVGPLVLQASNVYLITREDDDQRSRPFMIMAEEFKAGKISVRHALTAKRVKDVVPSLDLTRFKLLKLVQGYNFMSSNCVHKVLLCASSASSVEFLVLYYRGVLGKLSLDNHGDIKEEDENEDENKDEDEEEEEDNDVKLCYAWKNFKVRKGDVYMFLYLDDVVIFKDVYYGVDRVGKLYVIDTESMTARNTRVVVSEPICRGGMPCYRKKRLVVDEATNELHLVVRENVEDSLKVRFKVYRFNEQDKRWDVVAKIGRETVLFVGIDHCFFAAAKHFDECGGNCIVFAANCFTQYNGRDAPDSCLFGGKRHEVGVYRMGEGDNFQLLSSAFPEFTRIFWPPPTWLSTREISKDEEETEGSRENDKSSDEASENSFVSLFDKHVERPFCENETSSDEDVDSDITEILSDSSGKNEEDSVDEDEDEEMEADCSGTVDSNASSNSERSHSSKGHAESKADNSRKNRTDAQEREDGNSSIRSVI